MIAKTLTPVLGDCKPFGIMEGEPTGHAVGASAVSSCHCGIMRHARQH